MTKFRKMPGQEQPVVQGWPSSNHGWRFGVVIGSALILTGLLVCTLGALL